MTLEFGDYLAQSMPECLTVLIPYIAVPCNADDQRQRTLSKLRASPPDRAHTHTLSLAETHY
jgi:hypothetical protein